MSGSVKNPARSISWTPFLCPATLGMAEIRVGRLLSRLPVFARARLGAGRRKSEAVEEDRNCRVETNCGARPRKLRVWLLDSPPLRVNEERTTFPLAPPSAPRKAGSAV